MSQSVLQFQETDKIARRGLSGAATSEFGSDTRTFGRDLESCNKGFFYAVQLFSLLPLCVYVLLYVTALLESVTPGVKVLWDIITDYACTTAMKDRLNFILLVKSNMWIEVALLPIFQVAL
jgi:hypothetical protein